MLSAQAEEAQKKIQSATQVAMQTQRDVQGLSALGREAQVIGQKTTSEMQGKVQAMAQQVQEQTSQTVQQAQEAKIAQEQMAQQVAEAQRTAMSTTATSQQYETQLMEL